MTGFLESFNEREGELILERDENRRLCNEYIAQVSERQSQARRQASATLSCCMQDTRSTRGNPSSVPASVPFDSAVIVRHQDLRQPPALTKIRPGHMDAAHLQDIEQCMKKTDEKKNAYVAAVDSQEIKITGQVTENRRVRDEDLADIRVVVGSPNTAGTPDLGKILLTNSSRTPLRARQSLSLECPLQQHMHSSLVRLLDPLGGQHPYGRVVSWSMQVPVVNLGAESTVKRYRCGDAGRIPPRACSVLHGSWWIGPTRQAPLTCPMNCCVQSRLK